MLDMNATLIMYQTGLFQRVTCGNVCVLGVVAVAALERNQTVIFCTAFDPAGKNIHPDSKIIPDFRFPGALIGLFS